MDLRRTDHCLYSGDVGGGWGRARALHAPGVSARDHPLSVDTVEKSALLDRGHYIGGPGIYRRSACESSLRLSLRR